MISAADDGIVVVPGSAAGEDRGEEMYKAERALDERMEYSQLGPNRWRATYRGFVTLSSEGRDPKDAQFNLDEAFDLLLANLIRTSHRPMKAEPEVVVEANVKSAVKGETTAGAPPTEANDGAGKTGRLSQPR